MIGGLFRPGSSPLHRAPAGAKLLALGGLGTLLFALPSLWLAGLALLFVLAGYSLARLPAALVLSQLRPALWILAILFLAQLWLASLGDAALLVLRFCALILAAGLVTLTTRTADMVAVIERGLSPLARLGLDVEKTSLALSLAIRFIPAVATVLEEVREAQAARGGAQSAVNLAVPVILRLLKMADQVAEALDARS